ncbi:MAG: hypothetical protein M1813_007874 [Trichoglossum hirsutum]|nr:MAG: hypothetical protein M1813_007874 [Trichoglossum hirsutum]
MMQLIKYLGIGSRGTKDRTTSFLCLPLELRLAIYRLLLLAPRRIPLRGRPNNHPRTISLPKGFGFHIHTEILQVNRLIHREANQLLYSENIFFWHPGNLGIADLMHTSIGHTNRLHIRKIELQLTSNLNSSISAIKRLLELYPGVVELRLNKLFTQSPEVWRKAFKSVLWTAQGLKRLVIIDNHPSCNDYIAYDFMRGLDKEFTEQLRARTEVTQHGKPNIGKV